MIDADLSRIKVVFFDIGGIVLTNAWGHESREKAAEIFGFDYKEMEILHNFIYNVFEIGSISLDEYLDTVLFHCTRDFTKAEFKEFMFAQSIELPKMLSYLKDWKRNIDLPVFAISNESRELNDYRIVTFNLHEIFDGFFSSCYMAARKPDPRIFYRAMEIAQVKPGECIYFDDRPMLVKVAENLGMTSILHKEFETTKRILQEFIRK